MENMKEINNFKFNPIEFNGIKLYGLVGRLGTGDNIIRKGLIQNILYTIYNKSRAVNEIAEILNVSPVNIEYELEYLESFSLIIKDGKKYQANILIEERTKKRMEKENQLYTKIANKIAIPIYEIIKNSGILQSNDLTKIYNENYLMYNLFLYFFSEIFSNIFSTGREIEFDDVAEIRADGGNNIICAVVTNNLIAEHECENGEILLGPCYNSSKNEKDKTELKIFLIHDIQKQNRLSQIVMYVYDNILNSLNKIVNNQELSIDGKTELIERNLAKNKNGKIVLRIPVLYEGELTKKSQKN